MNGFGAPGLTAVFFSDDGKELPPYGLGKEFDLVGVGYDPPALDMGVLAVEEADVRAF